MICQKTAPASFRGHKWAAIGGMLLPRSKFKPCFQLRALALALFILLFVAADKSCSLPSILYGKQRGSDAPFSISPSTEPMEIRPLGFFQGGSGAAASHRRRVCGQRAGMCMLGGAKLPQKAAFEILIWFPSSLCSTYLSLFIQQTLLDRWHHCHWQRETTAVLVSAQIQSNIRRKPFRALPQAKLFREASVAFRTHY